MNLTRLSADDLVIACTESGSEEAWAEFIRRFHPLIARVVMRVCHQWGEYSPQAMDDLIQEAYLKLCSDRLRVLGSFRSQHKDAIFGYVKVFTANLVHDHLKGSRALKRGGPNATSSVDTEVSWEKLSTGRTTAEMLERRVLMQEIDAFLRQSSGPEAGRDRQIFWLYYRVGLSAAAIATLPNIGLTTKGVESTLLRLTRYVREQLVERRMKTAPESPEGIRPAESL